MAYVDIRKDELIRGVKYWKNPKNKFNVLMVHYSSDPLKDEEREGKEWLENEKIGVPKITWKKEYEIDFTTKSGKLIFGKEFCDFDSTIHLINSFELPEPYEQLISLDFGQRNPTAALVGIYTREGVLYIVDEYYKPALPSVASREMFQEFKSYIGNIEGKSLNEKRIMVMNAFPIRVIDPSTKSKNRSKISAGEEIQYSVIEEFYDHGWDFELANNDVGAGVTRIREYFQLDSNQKAHLYIFKDRCPYLAWELQNIRYKELTEALMKTRNDSEDIVKKNDHAFDSLRYMILTRPNIAQLPEKPKTRIQRDIESLLRPKIFSFDDDSLL